MDLSVPVNLILVIFISLIRQALLSDKVLPCVYEGELKTDKDWYGFMANITIMTTGRMTFEFEYPADKCCQNVLFYLEDQVSILNARMNCWQKEALLRPEDDQILRLTPRFSWSGCHMSQHGGVSTYICNGGRSFASTVGGDTPTSWYIAISNCASLLGLEMKYKLEILGHIVECKTAYKILTTPSYPNPALVQDGQAVSSVNSDRRCVLEGELNTTANWYGFIANVTLSKGGGFRFRFSYPYRKQVQAVILYDHEDIYKIRSGQSCWQREGIVRARRPEQIMDLSFKASHNGCVSKNSSMGNLLVCQGERYFDSPRKLYIAVNNCRARYGLELKYRFEFIGYQGKPCSATGLLTNAWRRTLQALLLAVITSLLAVNR